MADKYVTVQREVEALQFNIMSFNELAFFLGSGNFQITMKDGKCNCTALLDGVKTLIIENDWLVKSAAEKISIVKPDEFEKEYIKKEL